MFALVHSLIVDSPPPAAQIDWLNLSDATNVVRIIGLLIPVLTALITKRLASQGLKAVTTTVLSAVTAAAAVLVAADGHSFAWQAFVNAFINAFVPAIVTYYGLWKPTGVTGSVAAATHRFGIGPRPVLETADKGQDSPSSAVGKPEAGAVAVGGLGFLLALVGGILLLLHLLGVGGALLLTLGAILFVVGVLIALAPYDRRL